VTGYLVSKCYRERSSGMRRTSKNDIRHESGDTLQSGEWRQRGDTVLLAPQREKGEEAGLGFPGNEDSTKHGSAYHTDG